MPGTQRNSSLSAHQSAHQVEAGTAQGVTDSVTRYRISNRYRIGNPAWVAAHGQKLVAVVRGTPLASGRRFHCGRMELVFAEQVVDKNQEESEESAEKSTDCSDSSGFLSEDRQNCEGRHANTVAVFRESGGASSADLFPGTGEHPSQAFSSTGNNQPLRRRGLLKSEDTPCPKSGHVPKQDTCPESGLAGAHHMPGSMANSTAGRCGRALAAQFRAANRPAPASRRGLNI